MASGRFLEVPDLHIFANQGVRPMRLILVGDTDQANDQLVIAKHRNWARPLVSLCPGTKQMQSA